MKYFSLVCLLFFSQFIHAGMELDPKLKVFEPYLGTWEATFAMADGQADLVDVSSWERALNGTAIRTKHSINEGVYGGESFIFWDKDSEQLVFYYFTTAGFFTQGQLEISEDGSFVAYEDVSGSEEGITQVKSTSTFVDGKFVVATSYLKEGQWTKPEQRTYTRSNKSVIFK
ncbi:hypothetical protein AAEU32_11165 [Pseudoalteromonas sp. SSDWG2]|uniref:hypothetical protein n=1 Tax=Pseudoalteromonas sp. SSDWG2 TaxID=3139391 RepID=UPI003BAD3E41